METFYYVEKWGDRYGSVACYSSRAGAQAHLDRLMMTGAWQGMPPRIVRDDIECNGKRVSTVLGTEEQ